MALFEQIELWDKKEETRNGEGRYQLRPRGNRGEDGKSKQKKDRDNEDRSSKEKETTSIADCSIMPIKTIQ
jgi:hypothetical protein